MPKGILTEDPNRPIFYLNYDGIKKPIGRVLVTGPIGNPDHYIIKWDGQNTGDLSDVNISHSYDEALTLAHDFALTDLSTQCSGNLEDRTQFAQSRQTGDAVRDEKDKLTQLKKMGWA